MRLIDADNLISVLDILMDKGDDIQMWAQLKSVVASCPTIEPEVLACGEGILDESLGHWIPVTERLPNEFGWYTVTTNKGEVVYRWYSTLHGFELHGDDIVAWMPLPEPYKGET